MMVIDAKRLIACRALPLPPIDAALDALVTERVEAFEVDCILNALVSHI